MKKIQIVLVILSLALYCTDSSAQKGVGKETGVVREGLTPQIVNITGKVSEIKIGPCENTTGPSDSGTHLILETKEAAVINIHLGPTNRVNRYIREIKLGTEVEALGFRTEDLLVNNYVAKELSINGKTQILRDENLKPVWSGRRGRGN